jgi:hypothetical protein
VKEEPKRLVLDAVVAKSEVEVALVVVERTPTRSLKAVMPARVVEPRFAMAAKRLLEEAVVAKVAVEVAFPLMKTSPATASRAAGVVVPMPKKPLALMVKAAVVEVAYALEEVAM